MDKKINALFFDIDGTLVSFKTHKVPDSTVEAIKIAKSKGVGIYISTGRPLQIITNLGSISPYIDGYITTNGALCIVNGKTVCCNSIPQDNAELLISDAQKFDYTVIVVGDKNVGLYNYKPIFDDVFVKELNVTNIDTCLPVDKILERERILQFTPFISASHESVLMKELSECVSGRWHPAFTDITAKTADKGKGLEAMASYLNIDISATIAFGDGGNDIAILKRAGVGIAMGNAGENVKNIADYITTSVDNDGVWNALKNFNVI